MDEFVARGLTSKFGDHGFYVMYGAFSLPINKSEKDKDSDKLVIPKGRVFTKRGDKVELDFSAGASGKCLPAADVVKLVFYTLDLKTDERSRAFDTIVPTEMIGEIGFGVNATLELEAFENSTQLIIAVEVVFNNPDFIEEINTFAKAGEELIKDQFSISQTAARINIIIEDEEDHG